MIYKDYKEYIKQQVVRAESKWGRKPEFNEPFKKNLKHTLNKLNVGQPKSICCMGIRDGTELFVFKELFPQAEVVGTDITENIKTIKTEGKVKVYLQDFNNLPQGWTDKFGLVYSNSLDHSYDPKNTLKEWHRVTSKYILLELSTHSETNIEHTFTWGDLPTLFPPEMFSRLETWETPKRKILTVLTEVVK